MSVAACRAIWVVATVGSLRALALVERASLTAAPPPPSLALLAFRATAAAAWVATLVDSYADTRGLEITHRGRVVTVRHSGRFVTFTLWCNCVFACYWLSATACSAYAVADGDAPAWLSALSLLLWEVAFPLSWLVAAVVSYVLIPVAAKREPAKVEILLRWRPQFLHNGYVLAAALEALLARPPMVWSHLPLMVLFGMTYIAFAWLMHARLRVYAYIFIDPTFSWAPVAYVALMLASTGCFAGCCALTQHLGETQAPRATGAAMLAAALGTCTWRAPVAARSKL
ncbi:hypothetical protein KFE25_008339 [Diacronema lutheri]|uniref:Uncharacterized protein n=1 Tax=Diacronema lutheri TaxID=2081491 RepID=A0A8J5XWX9_DIALT|nr:hypothetical protein KFE25_008339 [Diacronema lutheri]